MYFGIILLPDDRAGAALAAYAQRVSADGPTIMCLGEKYLPHITLLHVDGTPEQAAELWDRCLSSVPATVEIHPTGVQFAAYAPDDIYLPDGGVYVGVEALRRSDLAAAHLRVLGHARDMGLRVLSGADEAFRPHVTLAALTATDRFTAPLPPAELLVPFDARLAWGEMGPHGTFSVIEASAP
ncbi:2'-5' RNA ligase family protein [Yinghuangia soli]|uniref:2'-5' RNA ligase family protein n=1 Tax=Yinghuangia soli TaxID=2908204 RepID=A0AA41U397_9ACTN|nr:2'-5' RNA ligase family protein [Yinghuangia soli]MCF2527864.1 2'-5' RNA ligase family protein [Yinghuangia soli]